MFIINAIFTLLLIGLALIFIVFSGGMLFLRRIVKGLFGDHQVDSETQRGGYQKDETSNRGYGNNYEAETRERDNSLDDDGDGKIFSEDEGEYVDFEEIKSE